MMRVLWCHLLHLALTLSTVYLWLILSVLFGQIEENKSVVWSSAYDTTTVAMAYISHISKHPPCSGPIETLVFVCRSLCCLCRTPLPPSLPHIFTFFPLSESCWQVYHLTSSLELWSTNNARYKGENPFRVEIFPITTSESEWTSYQISANILSTSHSCNPDS